MAWTRYRLEFRLLSPLHVGYRQVGNLMQTRCYVPGKLVWAALTARLTRDEHDGSQGSEYRRIGNLVRQHVRCGYLWPSLDGSQPYFPWEHDDFDYLLLDSYAGTALADDRAAALDGSLRETEYIAPAARDRRPVFLLGDLWVQEDELPPDLAGWKKALQRIQLGGERGYGWGRVGLVSDLSQPGEVVEPTLVWPAGHPIIAHALAVDLGRARAVPHVEGPVEPLVGWERKPDGGYGLTDKPVIAYAPGAMPQQDLRVGIGPQGIWETAA